MLRVPTIVLVCIAPLAAMDVNARRLRTSSPLPALLPTRSARSIERPVVTLKLRESAPHWLKIGHGVYRGVHQAYFGFLIPFARYVAIPSCVLALGRSATRPDMPGLSFGKPISRFFLSAILAAPASYVLPSALILTSRRLMAPRSFALQHNGRKLSSMIFSSALDWLLFPRLQNTK